MIYTFQFRLSGEEIREWIWLLWRLRFWRYAAAIPFVLVLGFCGAMAAGDIDPQPGMAKYLVVVALGFGQFGLGVLIYAVLFRALWRRHANVEIQASPQGLSIANRKLHVKWRDVLPVLEKDGAVIITTKRGQVIPLLRRAFGTDSQMEEFLGDVANWRGKGR